MLEYVVGRLAHSVVVLFIVTLIGFFITHVLPGDPTGQILGDTASPEAIEALREEIGLNDPLYEQYWDWLSGTLRLDLGKTFRSGLDVREELVNRLQPTIQIGVMSFALSITLAICLGSLAAFHRGGWIDMVARGIGVFGIATPNFWLAMVLIILISVKLDWLPAFGYVPFTEDPIENLKRVIMPVFAITIGQLAVTVRMMRASMIEVLGNDYVRTARAKGLRTSVIFYRHALRNALIPVFTVAGIQIGHILGGSAIIETIFAIPGVGRFTAESVQAHEYNVVQAVMLLAGISIVTANLVVDLSYGWLDPRIRLAGR